MIPHILENEIIHFYTVVITHLRKKRSNVAHICPQQMGNAIGEGRRTPRQFYETPH